MLGALAVEAFRTLLFALEATLVGALSALGIPKDSVLRYEAAIKADQFLVIVHGGTDDVRRGRKVLAAAGGVGAWIHFAA